HIPQVPLRTRRQSCTPTRAHAIPPLPFTELDRAGSAPVGKPTAAKQKEGPAGDVRQAHQVACYRYWPVLATVSMERPASAPFLPDARVRMETIRSPFLPEIRAQSSGLVVLGRSSFSLNSSTHAWSRWETRRPLEPFSR